MLSPIVDVIRPSLSLCLPRATGCMLTSSCGTQSLACARVFSGRKRSDTGRSRKSYLRRVSAVSSASTHAQTIINEPSGQRSTYKFSGRGYTTWKWHFDGRSASISLKIPRWSKRRLYGGFLLRRRLVVELLRGFLGVETLQVFGLQLVEDEFEHLVHQRRRPEEKQHGKSSQLIPWTCQPKTLVDANNNRYQPRIACTKHRLPRL